MRPSGKQFRELSISTREVDSEARTVTLAFSSEQPYERWWGIEILDHNPESVRLARLRDGGALLVGHDTADHVGVVEHVRLGADKVARATVRFGRSERAEEIFADVVDGIRCKASVGYVIHDLELEREVNGMQTYRVTDWEPLEISLVAVPADSTVGVGRSAQPTKGKSDMNEELSRKERRLARAGEEPAAHGGGAQSNTEEIIAAGREFAKFGGMQLAMDLLASGNPVSMETFKTRILEKMRTKTPPTRTGEPADLPPGMSGYDYGDGARQIINMPKYFGSDAGAKERAYRAGMWFRGLIGQWVPRYKNEAVDRYLRDNGLNRSMSEGSLTEGGAVVVDELSLAIIDLADKNGKFRQYGDVWPMKSDTMSVPRSAGDPAAAFVSENGQIPEAQGAWGMVNLTAEKLGTLVRISNELLEDAIIDMADRVAFQLGRSFATKEDQCGFLGDGTSAYGGMRGIFPLLIDGSHNAGKVVAATATHDTFAEIDTTDLSNVMAALPEYAHDGAKWYCSQVAWSLVFWRLMAAASGNSVSDIAGNVPKFYAGYPVVTSSVLPAGATTDYSNLTMMAFGNLRLSSKFGSRREMRIRVLSERYAEFDQIGIVATERFDIVNHDLGDNTTAGPMVGLVGGAS